MGGMGKNSRQIMVQKGEGAERCYRVQECYSMGKSIAYDRVTLIISIEIQCKLNSQRLTNLFSHECPIDRIGIDVSDQFIDEQATYIA